MMNIIIRTAQLSDAKAIAELTSELGYAASIKDIETRLYENLNSEDDIVLAALVDDIIAGWIHGFKTRRIESGTFVEIGGLVVAAKKRRRGIGKQLVQHIVEWASSNYHCKTRVRCNIKRTESHVFYERIGFAQNKTQLVFDLPPEESKVWHST